MDEIKTSKNKKMKKELKDYLHLYLGCECQLFWRREDGSLEFERIGELITIKPEDKDHHGLVFKCKTSRGNFIDYAYPYYDVKPILRPLSDMTKTESDIADEILNVFDGESAIVAMQGMANMTLYLLRGGFDVFGLIESGLALDATVIYTPTQLGGRTDAGTSPTKI